MSQQVFDVALELLAPGAALAATGQSTGKLLYPRMLPTCDWVVYWSALVATGTYVMTLEVSDVVGGTYTVIATFTIPPALAAGKEHIPINADLATLLDNDSKYIRVKYTIGGATPGAVIGSYLAKAANKMGAAYRVGDAVSV